MTERIRVRRNPHRISRCYARASGLPRPPQTMGSRLRTCLATALALDRRRRELVADVHVDPRRSRCPRNTTWAAGLREVRRSDSATWRDPIVGRTARSVRALRLMVTRAVVAVAALALLAPIAGTGCAAPPEEETEGGSAAMSGQADDEAPECATSVDMTPLNRAPISSFERWLCPRAGGDAVELRVKSVRTTAHDIQLNVHVQVEGTSDEVKALLATSSAGGTGKVTAGAATRDPASTAVTTAPRFVASRSTARHGPTSTANARASSRGEAPRPLRRSAASSPCRPPRSRPARPMRRWRRPRSTAMTTRAP